MNHVGKKQDLTTSYVEIEIIKIHFIIAAYPVKAVQYGQMAKKQQKIVYQCSAQVIPSLFVHSLVFCSLSKKPIHWIYTSLSALSRHHSSICMRNVTAVITVFMTVVVAQTFPRQQVKQT